MIVKLSYNEDSYFNQEFGGQIPAQTPVTDKSIAYGLYVTLECLANFNNSVKPPTSYIRPEDKPELYYVASTLLRIITALVGPRDINIRD